MSEEGLLENTMLWELNFIGPMAGKVGTAGQQQRTAYEENINIEIVREYNCSMLNWRVGYSRSLLSLLASPLLVPPLDLLGVCHGHRGGVRHGRRGAKYKPNGHHDCGG